MIYLSRGVRYWRDAHIQEMMRRRPFAARYDREVRPMINRAIRRYVALDIESPTPVPIAPKATKHAGHFGRSASMAPGIIHPAMLRERRTNLRVGRSPSEFRLSTAWRPEPLAVTTQQP